MGRGGVVTIRQVARAAGVSAATVSRVMNGSSTVAPDLVERVRHRAEEMGYRPNAAAQGLARGRTGTFGVLVPDLANPYFHDVLKGIGDEAGADGYRMLVADSDEHPDAEAHLAAELLTRTDGLILCSPRMSRQALAGVLAQDKPVVATNRMLLGTAVPTVLVDSYRGMTALAGHLAQLGHRRLAYLDGPATSWSNQERRRALQQAAAFGLEVQVVPCGSTMAEGKAVAASALTRGVTALVAFNDLVAFGALAGLRERGIAVPGDAAISGFDDIPFAAYAAPALTTVRTPKSDLGRRAWRTLQRLLSGDEDLDAEILTPELMIRASTG